MNQNKRNRIISIVGSLVILTIGGLVLNQIHKNQQANKLIIEKCFENFEKVEQVVIKKDGFWSPVTCEKNSIKYPSCVRSKNVANIYDDCKNAFVCTSHRLVP